MLDHEQLHNLLLALATLLALMSIAGITYKPLLRWWRTSRPRKKQLRKLHHKLQGELSKKEQMIEARRGIETQLHDQWIRQRGYPPIYYMEDAHGVGEGTVYLLQQHGFSHVGQLQSAQQLMNINGIGPQKAQTILQGKWVVMQRWDQALHHEYINDVLPNQHQPEIDRVERQARWAADCLAKYKAIDLRDTNLLSWRGGALWSLVSPVEQRQWDDLEDRLNKALVAARGKIRKKTPPRHNPGSPKPKPVFNQSDANQPNHVTKTPTPKKIQPPPIPSPKTPIKPPLTPPERWLNILRKKYTPTDFERYIALLWHTLGYHTELTPATGDHGVDVIAIRPGERVVIECKRYRAAGSVGNNVIRSIAAHKSDLQNPATHAVVVTTGYFTEKAYEASLKFGVELIGPDELISLIKHTNVYPNPQGWDDSSTSHQ